MAVDKKHAAQRNEYVRSRIDYWADWLVDAVACASQDRRLLRGDPDEDEVLTEALLANAKKAFENVVAEVLKERAL